MSAADDAINERLATEPKYYHGSSSPLPVGAVLKAKATKLYRGGPLGEVMEEMRPSEAPPRFKTWYMTTDPCAILDAGGDPNNTYEVRPTGPVTPANYAWFRKFGDEILAGKNVPFRRAARYAQNYWSNAPSEDPEYEWLAPEIEVVKKVKTCIPKTLGKRWIRLKAKR